eukprot:CAMPEP_0185725474 /NCGR_PEP_ID=MMETSP1171-20130828/1721_1 /TAXON_ID=374046 /ORGANISM="Helicotheca tamensis, Strain CCMP826" /LENGTH=230 /DNA_ID=CAMNT_0028393615 /DNA_START=48 /DNA_END=740 /DNA_ORIENTATION=+
MADTKEDKAEFDWPPLESNPEIFTTYMHSIGLSSQFQIGEVFGFDEELLAFLPQPTHGIIVAVERASWAEDRQKGSADNISLVDFYMDQSGTLDNACGIIACIHASLNTPVEIAPDSILGRFHSDNADKTPAERCKSLEENKEFKTHHKGYAMEGQSAPVTSDQSKVNHHFIAFVVKNGMLIELDGTKKGPHVIDSNCDDVLRGSIKEIQRRLEDGEITDKLSMMTLSAA